jgi:regulatory protein
MEDCEQELRIKVRKSMMGLLARREHSRRELLQKTQLKGFDEHLINANLDEFIEQDWQSDSRYAAMLIRSRISKCHGPIKIRMELKQKGISNEIIDLYMLEYENWNEVALTALTKKFTIPNRQKNESNKQYRFLQQRGFANEHIKWAIKNLK